VLYNAATPDRRMSVPGASAPLDPADPGLLRLSRLRAVVLLAGSVRANHLRKLTNRRALHMPIAQGQTVLDCWREQLTSMAERLGVSALPVRVMVDQATGENTASRSHGPIELTVEPDPLDLRGTGGLLSDIAREYDDDDLLLIGHASQLLFEPLAALTAAIASSSRDVSICGRSTRSVISISTSRPCPRSPATTTCGLSATSARSPGRCARYEATSMPCVVSTASMTGANAGAPKTGNPLSPLSNPEPKSTNQRFYTTASCSKAGRSRPVPWA